MWRFSKSLLLLGIGLAAFVVAGIGNTLEAALEQHFGRNLPLGLGAGAVILYFYGAAKLSPSKHKSAIVSTFALSIIGYVALAAFLLSFR